jgi:hypothetical protein
MIIINREREIAMTLTDAVILFGIIAAFTIFAMVLAWGEHQTRGVNRNLGLKPEKPSGVNEPLAQNQLPAQGDEGATLIASISERREMAHS